MAVTEQHAQLRSFEQLFVGGTWREPAGSRRIDIISPTTEEVIAHVPEPTEADVDAAVAAARAAFDAGPWPRMTPTERGAVLLRVADELEARLEEFIVACTLELGAPLAVSRGLHMMALQMLRSNAGFHERIAWDDRRTSIDGESLVIREPVGVVATICPWNGPVASICQKLSPALAAGCTAVVKPAPEAPVTPLMFAEVLEAAGMPEGVVSILPAGREIGAYLVGHRDVDKVSFTGSTAAGRKVMAACADRIARVTLELGGKSAGIVTDDIPLDEVLPSLMPWGTMLSGQVCCSTTRILVSRERHDELVEAAAEMLGAMKVGDPMDESTWIGPLVAERQRDRVEGYIAVGREEGATLAVGGGRPEGITRGWFIEPTLFANVKNEMRIAQEEIFGPVLSVIPYKDYDDAVRIANDSQYGLSGAVYASDLGLAESIARRMRTGQIFLNTASACVVEPFGGYKQSGLGREGGVEGVEAYLETKVIRAA